MTDLQNMPWGCNVMSNPNGIKTSVFLAMRCDILTVPKLKANPETPADEVALEGDFVMKDGKTFIEIHSTEGKGKFSFNPLGGKDQKKYETMINMFYPDIDDIGKLLAMKVLNNDVVALVATREKNAREEADFKWMVVGAGLYETENTFSGDSGDAADSDKGLTGEIKCIDSVPGKVYSGVISLPEGATYDCSTNEYSEADGGQE